MGPSHRPKSYPAHGREATARVGRLRGRRRIRSTARALGGLDRRRQLESDEFVAGLPPMGVSDLGYVLAAGSRSFERTTVTLHEEPLRLASASSRLLGCHAPPFSAATLELSSKEIGVAAGTAADRSRSRTVRSARTPADVTESVVVRAGYPENVRPSRSGRLEEERGRGR